MYQELCRDFEVLGWQEPFEAVRRQSDGQLGTPEYQDNPRRYYAWKSYAMPYRAT